MKMIEFWGENPRKSRNFPKFPKFPKFAKIPRNFPEISRKSPKFTLFCMSCTRRSSREIWKGPKIPRNFPRKKKSAISGNFREFPEFPGFWPPQKNIVFIKFRHRKGVLTPRKIRGNLGKFRDIFCPKFVENPRKWEKMTLFFNKTALQQFVHPTYMTGKLPSQDFFFSKSLFFSSRRNFKCLILSIFFFWKKSEHRIFLRLWPPCRAGGGQFSLRFFDSKPAT